MTASGTSAIAERMTGFISHLRLNGFALGPAETELALRVLDASDGVDVRQDRLGLKTALSADREQWQTFEALFEAYWFARGRARDASAATSRTVRSTPPIAGLWQQALEQGHEQMADSPASLGQSDPDTEYDAVHGRLMASTQRSVYRKDLRKIVDPDELRQAQAIALKLAQAIHVNLSRRRRAARRGQPVDLRRTLRASLARGGEPIDLYRRCRPVRPVRLVLLLDVSASMQDYSRPFLQFAKGLIGQWLEAEAFIFHTRLVKVSDALRERDPFRAMARLTLMTQGIGGGTRIGGSLAHFNDQYAAGTLNSRSVAVVISDGYDTGPPEQIARELARLQRKTRRIVWLNPLAGWRDYEPVAQAMAAAMPFIDCFAPATTLQDLAAIEPMLRDL